MKKTDLRVIKTKKLFQLSLINLLNEFPLEKIKVAELCREANVSRGTFYLHYETVHDVFVEYYEEVLNDLKASYEAPIRNKLIKNGRLEDATQIKIFHHVKKYEEFYRLTFSKKIPIGYYFLIHEKLGSLLREAIQQNINHTSEDIDYLVSYQSNAIMGIILEWHNKNFQHSAEYINKQLLRIINNNYNL